MDWVIMTIFAVASVAVMPEAVQRMLFAAILGFVAFAFLCKIEPQLTPEWLKDKTVQNDSTTVQNTPDEGEGDATE